MNNSLKKNWGLGLGVLLATGGFNTAFAETDTLFTRISTASVCPPEYIPAIYVAPLSKDATAEEVAEKAAAVSSLAIEADQIESTKSGQMLFKGNAVTDYDRRRISGDILGFDRDTSVLTGEGNVKLLNDYGDALETNTLRLNTETGIGETGQAHFLLGDRTIPVGEDKKAILQARGSANVLEFQGQDLMSLKTARYTTCKSGNDSVVVAAKTVDLDMATGIGVARNATVRFLGLPIMYTPYMSFPIGNQRKSGLLFPTFGKEGDSGTVVMLPYYWNIAPNMDATITPKNMSARGFELMSEFRYLTDTSAGLFRGEYLPDDKLFDDSRWGVYYQHDQTIGENWSAQVLYQDVSDNNYLNDLENELEAASAQFLPQQISLGYASDTINFSALARDLKTIDENITPKNEPHRELPRLALSAYNAYEPNSLKYGFDSELVNFDHDVDVTGQRIHLEPSVSLPMEAVYGFVTPKLAVDYTSYSLDNIPDESTTTTADGVDFGDTADSADATTATTTSTSADTTTSDGTAADSGTTQAKSVAANSSQITSNPSRTVPIFSLDTGLYFERDTLFSGRSYTQTLEPRIFYLYVPDEDQGDYPLFDTAEVNENTVTNLFLPNRFTSYDRLGDANQVTLALTTSLIDFDDGTEVLRGSIGQIYYLDDRQITLTGEPDTSSSSGIVMELTARLGKRALSPREQRLKQVNLERSRIIGDDWYSASEIGSERVNINTTLVWDTEAAQVSETRFDVAYTPNSYSLFDFEYTFRQDSEGLKLTDQYNVQAVVPLTRQFFLYGGYRYDAINSATLEGKGGIEYRSCCWAFRVYGTHRIDSTGIEDDYRDSVMAELELTGLATIRSKSGL